MTFASCRDLRCARQNSKVDLRLPADDLIDPLARDTDDARDRGEALTGLSCRNDGSAELPPSGADSIFGPSSLRGRAGNTCERTAWHLRPNIGVESDLHFPRKGYFHLTLGRYAS
jgi:hypothetical protein